MPTHVGSHTGADRVPSNEKTEMKNNDNYQTATLRCGLRVIYRFCDSPIINCGYQIMAGTRDEQPGQEGLAHFCEHSTLKGTERRTARQVQACLDSVGGALNAYTNKDLTCYYASVLREELPRAVDLLSDIVFHSVYPKEELRKERDVILQEIGSYNDAPADLIFDDFENAIYKGTDMGHYILGTKSQVKMIRQPAVAQWAHDHYHASRAVFYCLGDIRFEELIRLLDAALADQPDAVPVTFRHDDAPTPYTTGGQTIRKKYNSYQAHVMVGRPTFIQTDSREPVINLLNSLLCGIGMNALLNLALREDQGLVYSVEGCNYYYRNTGNWSVFFSSDHHDIDKCLDIIRHQFDRLMSEPLSPDRLEAAKRQRIGQLRMLEPRGEAFAQEMATLYLNFGQLLDDGALCRSIADVTAEEIRQLAQWLFEPGQLTTYIYE